jgi:hypothetical protein
VGADEVADSAADDAVLDADEAVLPVSSLEHAATPKIASALSPAAAMVLRRTCGRAVLVLIAVVFVAVVFVTVVLVAVVFVAVVFIDTVSFIRGG